MKKEEHKPFTDRLMMNYHLRVFGKNDYRLYDVNGLYDAVDELKLNGVIVNNLNDDDCNSSTVKAISNLWTMNLGLRRSWLEVEKEMDPYLILFKNGHLDTRTMTFYNHTPNKEFYIQVDTVYDPQATCNKFISQLNRSLPDKAEQMRLQEMFGISLTSHRSLQKFFVLLGEGGTGKSTIIRVLEHLLGEKSYSSIALQDFTKNFYNAELHMKLANTYADLPDEDISDSSILKLLTGGDKITASRKFQPLFSYRSFATLVFSTNYYPRFSGKTGSEISRRMEIIHFNQVIPDSIKYADFETELFSEASGIINWALEGLQRLYRNNFRLTVANQTLNATYSIEKNSVAAFINRATCITGIEKDYILSSEFHNEFTKFCVANKVRPLRPKEVVAYINENLPNVQRKRLKETRKYAYSGIKFKLIDSNEIFDGEVEMGIDIPSVSFDDEDYFIPAYDENETIDYDSMQKDIEEFQNEYANENTPYVYFDEETEDYVLVE